jgi:hypothetical protein
MIQNKLKRIENVPLCICCTGLCEDRPCLLLLLLSPDAFQRQPTVVVGPMVLQAGFHGLLGATIFLLEGALFPPLAG